MWSYSTGLCANLDCFKPFDLSELARRVKPEPLGNSHTFLCGIPEHSLRIPQKDRGLGRGSQVDNSTSSVRRVGEDVKDEKVHPGSWMRLSSRVLEFHNSATLYYSKIE